MNVHGMDAIYLMAGFWAAAWVAAKIVSKRHRWGEDLAEDTWVRACVISAAAVVPMGLWAVLLIPLLVWAYRDAGEQAAYWQRRQRIRCLNGLEWDKREYVWERRVLKER